MVQLPLRFPVTVCNNIRRGKTDSFPQVRRKTRTAVARAVCMSSSEQPCVYIHIEVRVLGAVSMGQVVDRYSMSLADTGQVLEFIDFGFWFGLAKKWRKNNHRAASHA